MHVCPSHLALPVHSCAPRYEMGRQPAMTKLSSNVAVRKLRVRGGNEKFRALRLDSGNFAWPTEVGSSWTPSTATAFSLRPGSGMQQGCEHSRQQEQLLQKLLGRSPWGRAAYSLPARLSSLLPRRAHLLPCRPSRARPVLWTWCTTRPTTSWCALRRW